MIHYLKKISGRYLPSREENKNDSDRRVLEMEEKLTKLDNHVKQIEANSSSRNPNLGGRHSANLTLDREF